MKIRYNNDDKFISLYSCLLEMGKITVAYDGIAENFSGFNIYDDDEKTIIKNCEDFIYRWDIYHRIDGVIVYTNSKNNLESNVEISSNEDDQYLDSKIGISELTNCVADLMLEISLMKLGLEV